MLLVDETTAFIGSANMDMRSLFYNYEIATFVYSKPEIRSIAEWASALAEDTVKGVAPVGYFQDICEGMVRLAAPLL